MRTVAITGAARGIGEAIARELAGRYDLLLGDLDGCADLAAELGAVQGPLDVTDQASYEAWLALVPRVDVLVNNAGIMWVGPYDAEPESVARKQFDVNVFGVMRGTRLAIAGGAGTVVTVASAASYIAPAGEATYAATKHAVLGWMKALRVEAPQVQICLELPTVVTTELAAGTVSGGVPPLTPADVARAVAGVIEKPRFETFVPSRVAVLQRVLAVLPQRGKDLMHRRLVPNQVQAADHAARAAYEVRHLPGE
jgi:short-subunit dehydrogenase